MTDGATGDASSGGFRLLSDRPHLFAGDPLGFGDVVDGLGAVISASRDSTPFTLGIEASWGRGKSTLMGALRISLAQDPSVTTVEFNAWTAEDGRVLEGFVKTVLNQIDAGILRRAMRNERLMGLAGALLSAAGGYFGVSSVVDKVWAQVAEDPRTRNDLRDLVERAVGAWRKKRPDLGETCLLCVFVDDLDRCSPPVVLEVLEAMKLYLDVPGVVFVVGYDENIVSDIVLHDKGYEDKITARDYLEKFIQISYRIPRPEDVQSEDLVGRLLEEAGIDNQLGKNERQLVIGRSDSNPRRIKRFINNFVLLNRLDPALREFHAQSLVRILLLQMYFPEFAALLERPSERDPVEEFIEYQAAREALRRGGGGGGDGPIANALRSHGLLEDGAEPQGQSDQLLRELEEYVPIEFPSLVVRWDFVTLVNSLGRAEDWASLRPVVSRGALAQVASPVVDATKFWQREGFSGRRILWIDDDMSSNLGLLDLLREGDARVATATDEVEMEAALDTEMFDVLISDIGRGDDPEAGFDAVRDLRDRRPLETPDTVIFFTARKTPARIEKAKELEAMVTADSSELLDAIARLPRDER